jgi:hypothetical protein
VAPIECWISSLVDKINSAADASMKLTPDMSITMFVADAEADL